MKIVNRAVQLSLTYIDTGHKYKVVYVLIIFFRAVAKPKSEMTQEELAKREEEEFNTGPLSVLTESVKNNNQVLLFTFVAVEGHKINTKSILMDFV